MQKGNYKSILGAASDVDRAEKSYALAYIDSQNGDVHQVKVEACTNDPRELHMLCEAMLKTLGEAVVQAGHEQTGRELPAHGFTTNELALLTGVSAMVTACLVQGSDMFNFMLSRMVGNAVDELVIKKKSISQLAEEMKDRE